MSTVTVVCLAAAALAEARLAGVEHSWPVPRQVEHGVAVMTVPKTLRRTAWT